MAVLLWLPGQGTLNQVRVLELAKLSSGAAVGCCPGHLGSGLDEVARLCSNSFPNGLAHSKAEIGMPSTSRVCVTWDLPLKQSWCLQCAPLGFHFLPLVDPLCSCQL